MYLPLWIKLRKNKKNKKPPPKWAVGEEKGEGVWGILVGGYMLVVVVCAYVGFGWNTGDYNTWMMWYFPLPLPT